jgi:diguanylate cyclase (GGDEF)-like protein
MSALAVPFEGRDDLLGVLTLYHADQNAFSREHVRILRAASLHVGLALENALTYRHAESSSATDHLTGIPNGRSFAAHLERELARVSRDNSSIGVVVCDLDGFKQVNDRFGHLKGNEVLKSVADGLHLACRDSDFLARIGGDEFVIVVPGLQEELDSGQLERFQAIAVEVGWAVCGEPCLSMSLGIALYPGDGRDTESLLAEADRRMYVSKRTNKTISRLGGPPKLEMERASIR